MLLTQGPGFILVPILLAAAPLAQAPCLLPDGGDSSLACLPYSSHVARGVDFLEFTAALSRHQLEPLQELLRHLQILNLMCVDLHHLDSSGFLKKSQDSPCLITSSLPLAPILSYLESLLATY